VADGPSTPAFLQTRLDLIAPRPADDEPQDEAPNDAALFGAQWPPASSTQLAVATSQVQAPWHHFPRGPSAGNFLHEQMEWLASEGFALLPGTATAERLAKRCERAGHKAQAQGVVQWLARLVAQPLAGPNVALNALSAQHQLLPEMEFWLPAERLLARDIDALCQLHLLPGVARPQLPDAQLHGMLMGFADLVFEHAGRYWVLDYKSNQLGTEDAAYTAQADDVLQWLSRVVALPLRGPGAPLNALGSLLPEMEFWLPAERLHAREVAALCQQHLLPGVSRPQLPDAQLHGMLMGFADLVFEHAGRY